MRFTPSPHRSASPAIEWASPAEIYVLQHNRKPQDEHFTRISDFTSEAQYMSWGSVQGTLLRFFGMSGKHQKW